MAANAAAISERLPADLVFCNHVLPGGAVGAATGARFAVKAHGSELEYSIRGRSELAEAARAALAPAEAVFVGSDHIREVLEDVVGPFERVHEVPPGVDVEEFTPQPRDEALRDLLDECRRDPPNPGNANERLPDEGNAERLERFLEGDKPTVLYFGKLLYNKGVHLLLEALHGLDARAVIVGFGDYRERLEAAGAAANAVHGPAGAPPSRPPDPARRRRRRAVDLPRGLRHGRRRGGRRRLPAHRRQALGPRGGGRRRWRRRTASEHRELASFAQGDSVELQEKLHDLLALPAEERRQLGAAARRVAVERWSWESVAQRLLEPFQ